MQYRYLPALLIIYSTVLYGYISFGVLRPEPHRYACWNRSRHQNVPSVELWTARRQPENFFLFEIQIIINRIRIVIRIKYIVLVSWFLCSYNLKNNHDVHIVSGSLEDLVSTFDEKLTMCFQDFQEQVDKIAPVQVKEHYLGLFKFRTWKIMSSCFFFNSHTFCNILRIP
jgi:hypothetical protein